MKTFTQIRRELHEEAEGDHIDVNVPLFIRLLEWAREDAKTDMDLHKVAERAVSLSMNDKLLTMDHYEKLVK